ncbi:MAG: HlyD family secretion protein [Nitrospiraceae bacterium]|nr:HlyD family secretion protein [Nitrospiraceae bacterium]
MQENQQEKKPAKSRRKLAFVIFGITGIVAAFAVFFYIQYKKTHISTDDAFVDGNVHTIASKVSGTVCAINVNDNQFVKQGGLLVEIDPTDYDVRVREARSGLGAEEGKFSEYRARIEAARKQLLERQADVKAANAGLQLEQANLSLAEKDIRRAGNLYKKEAISKERYDNVQTGYEVAVARVKNASEKVKMSQSAVQTQKAVIVQLEKALLSQASVINQKKASLEAAQLNAGYTKIYAPADGFVTKKSVQLGNQIQPAQPLMAIVPLSDVWVTANYKETDIKKMKPGQKVDIEVDTYPGRKFRGTVQSIMAGTGAVFSLFPPENATGNYVKVVQRIPVKIVINPGEDPDHILRIGMSVVPTVIVR